MESHFRLWIKENEVYIAGAMAHIRCVFKMQDSENEAIILLQLEDYKYCQTPSDKVLNTVGSFSLLDLFYHSLSTTTSIMDCQLLRQNFVKKSQ